MNKKNVLSTVIAIVAVLLVIVGLNSIVITYENEYTLVRMFGKIDRVITEEGISFKIPFVEETDKLPRQVLLYDLAASDVITMDKKTMVTDTYVLWEISNPQKFAKTLSASVTNAEGRINAAVYNSMKEVIATLSSPSLALITSV